MCMYVCAYVRMYVVTSYLLQVAMMSCEFFVSCAVLCSDIWAMGCVLYELTTLKHAVSLCTSGHAVSLCTSGHAVSLCTSGHAVSLCTSGHAVSLCTSGHAVSLCMSGHAVSLCTSGHAVSLCMSGHAYTYVYMDWYVRTYICTEMIVRVCM